MQLMVKMSTVYGEPLFMRYQVRSELKVSKPIGDMQKVGISSKRKTKGCYQKDTEKVCRAVRGHVTAVSPTVWVLIFALTS